MRAPPVAVVESATRVTNAEGLELDAAISPDGKLVAYVAGPINRTRVFVRQLSGGTARPLFDEEHGAQRTPRWSPDGQQLSFLVGQTLFTAPALGGPARPLLDASGYEYASPALSPDGSTIAFAKQNGIYLRGASGGVVTKLAIGGLGSVSTTLSMWRAPSAASRAFIVSEAVCHMFRQTTSVMTRVSRRTRAHGEARKPWIGSEGARNQTW